MHELKKENKVLDEHRYEKELLNIKIRLGFVNAQKILAHKLRVLSEELNDAHKDRQREKRA